MERRVGIISILVKEKNNINQLNSLLSKFSNNIIARLGLPFKNKNINLIVLIVEVNTDELGAITGKIGKIDGIKVKSMLTEFYNK